MAREPKFLGTITYSKRPVAGVTLYSDRKTEPTIEEMLDELERSDIRDVRKEVLLRKLRERGGLATRQGEPPAQPNPKRYLVDSETGRIDIDEENGDLTYKDALLMSSSIKGKSGQYDDAINLINAARTLAQDGQPKETRKPKEYYVEPDTGVIVHDPDNGEYTLSEARAVSQSLQRVTPGQAQPPPTYVVDSEGARELKPGEPIVIKQPPAAPPPKTLIVRQTAEGIVAEEHDLGKPIIINAPAVQGSGQGSGFPGMVPFPVFGTDGKPVYDSDGKPVYADIDPMMKMLGFRSEEKRADERHSMLMGLGQTVRENFGDGIQAIKDAVSEVKGEGKSKKAAQQPTVYECSTCHTKFSIPDVPFETVTCPNPECGRVFSKEEVTRA